MTNAANEPQKDAIRNWWANAPMTYGEDHGRSMYTLADGSVENVELGSPRFFELADAVFYRWNEPLHHNGVPFAKLFEYERFQGKRVLEVGCGMGCMSMNWARQGAVMTSIDLNPVSIAQTRRRFEVFGLEGDIQQADAEKLPFADGTFDHVYSWGVVHHTSNIRAAISEMYRVLKPGGRASLMLYNRHSILSKILVGWAEGFVNLENLSLDPLELSSRYGDGARQEGNPHTWPVTKREIRRDLMPQFDNLEIKTLGTDVPEALNTWLPRLTQRMMTTSMVKSLARRWGWSLWMTGDKPSW
ncbi:MAG: class I SAM-dependent methyltransferase [Alphaproteobacteria bacterium]|nr:class I SAM-dependent methyltransferase [Alphaproteobacteria bacterium]